jgi:hypothetical protein
MDRNRQKVVDQCRKDNELFRADKFVYMRHLSDRKGRKMATLLAYQYKEGDSHRIWFGWSKCNLKEDQFNNQLGQWKAWKRAHLLSLRIDLLAVEYLARQVPQSIQQQTTHFLEHVKVWHKTRTLQEAAPRG